MATSKIQLYKTDFPAGENIYVDQLDQYLQSIAATSHIIDNFQYIRHGLEITIKLNLDQADVNDFQYNYCSITNSDDGIPFYYAIVGAAQVAQETVALDLALDTINTLGQDTDSVANPYNFGDETVISRQHGDRFIFDNPSASKLYRKIDEETEGIAFEKHKTDKTKLTEKGAELDWYLIYRNRDLIEETTTPNPIDTFLCASKEIHVKDLSSHITTADIPVGDYWYFHITDNPNGSLSGMKLGSMIKRPWNVKQGTGIVNYLKSAEVKCIGLRNNNGQLQYTFIYNIKQYCNESYAAGDRSYYGNNYNFNMSEDIELAGNFWNNVEEMILDNPTGIFYTSSIDAAAKGWDWAQVYNQFHNTSQTVTGTETIKDISSIDNVDRTDTRIVKIIKLPYCPTDPLSVTFDAALGDYVYDFSDRWSPNVYSNILISYYGSLPQFNERDITTITWSASITKPATISRKDPKVMARESKLWHSDFHTEKLTYDSFSKPIKLEKITPDLRQGNIDISFKPTSTINSNLGFKFAPQNSAYLDEEDFDQILLAQRNNEEMLMNSEYINYVNTGLNYDKKMNNQAMASAVLNNVANMFGTGSSIANSVIDRAQLMKEYELSDDLAKGSKVYENVKYLKNVREARSNFSKYRVVGGSIATGVGLANGIAQTVLLHEQQKAQMCQKLAELERQATSVSGSDDIDLMSWYSDNKLWHFIYDIPEYARKYLYKLFDLTGYSHTAIEKPNIDSRCNYNFIQCQPFFKPDTLKKFHAEYMQDLKSKYEEGVTVFHRAPDGTYDFARQYENWEKWILA